ncbi:Phosphatidylserine decarboxylase-like protein [Candidatus Magnetoovum chiemensis]|nr:Phosphatidylserine decarboxylase-like protein [Candidatus Magnetoovum chiemensis]
MVKIAHEGYPFIIASILLAIGVFVFMPKWVYIFPIVIVFFMFYFFRDPERTAPNIENAIVSPADGKIILIEKTYEDIYLKSDAIRVSIFMSPLNVHVNRAPFDGSVETVKHKPGGFNKAYTKEAALTNESISMVLDTKAGKMLVRQIAGAVARRAVCRVKPGDRLIKGQRFGIIKFSSRVDIFLPLNVELKVRLNDKVRAGETIIGELI